MSLLNNTVTVGTDTVCVVTGASAGVGRAVVRLLGKRGAKVALLARGTDGLNGAKVDVERAGGVGLVIPTDVSDAAAVESAAERAERELGPIDLWVNNAMVSMYSPFERMTPDEFQHVVDVTFMGSVHGTRAALKRMVPRDRGVVVQVGSALAYRSIPLQSAYCASKHAIEGFIESVRSELIHDGSHVRISMVNLPGVNTPQFEWTKNNMPHKCRPAGTIYQPELAAEAVVFAAEHWRREIMLAYPTVEATLGEKVIPGLLDYYLAKVAWEGAMRDEPNSPDHQDNFWHPLPGDHGAHGPFDDSAHYASPVFWATKNRGKVLAGLLAAGLGGIAYLAGRHKS